MQAHNGTTNPLLDLSTARPMDLEALQVLTGSSRLAAVRPPTDRALTPTWGALGPSVQGAQAASIQAEPCAAGPAVGQEAGSQVGSGLPEAANIGIQQEATTADQRHAPQGERQGALHKVPGPQQLQPPPPPQQLQPPPPQQQQLQPRLPPIHEDNEDPNSSYWWAWCKQK